MFRGQKRSKGGCDREKPCHDIIAYPVSKIYFQQYNMCNWYPNDINFI